MNCHELPLITNCTVTPAGPTAPLHIHRTATHYLPPTSQYANTVCLSTAHAVPINALYQTSLLFVQYSKRYVYFASPFPCVSNLCKRTRDRHNGLFAKRYIFWGTTTINTPPIQMKGFISMSDIRL